MSFFLVICANPLLWQWNFWRFLETTFQSFSSPLPNLRIWAWIDWFHLIICLWLLRILLCWLFARFQALGKYWNAGLILPWVKALHFTACLRDFSFHFEIRWPASLSLQSVASPFQFSNFWLQVLFNPLFSLNLRFHYF